MQCLKSQTFSDSCAENRHDLLAKIVQHINGTSAAERGSSADPTLMNNDYIQGCKWRVGRVGDYPPSFWQNGKCSDRAAAHSITY